MKHSPQQEITGEQNSGGTHLYTNWFSWQYFKLPHTLMSLLIHTSYKVEDLKF